MKYITFSQKIAKEKLKPLYIITGKETFLQNETIRLIKEKIGEERIFFKEYIADEDFKMGDLLSDLYSNALFEDINLIILKNADKIIKDLYNPVAEYLKNSPESTNFLIIFKKLDQRTKFKKMVEKKATIITCDPLSDRVAYWKKGSQQSEIVQWICSRVPLYNKNISLQAAMMLSELIGNDLGQLDLQISKLALFNKENVIQVNDINKLVEGTKKINIFDLLDSIFACQCKKSIELCYLLFDRGVIDKSGSEVFGCTQIALQLLRLIHYRVKQIWKFSIAKNTNGIPNFLHRKLAQDSKRFNANDLIQIWDKLLKTEIEIKKSQIHSTIIIEQLILFIVSKKQLEVFR